MSVRTFLAAAAGVAVIAVAGAAAAQPGVPHPGAIAQSHHVVMKHHHHHMRHVRHMRHHRHHR